MVGVMKARRLVLAVLSVAAAAWGDVGRACPVGEEADLVDRILRRGSVRDIDRLARFGTEEALEGLQEVVSERTYDREILGAVYNSLVHFRGHPELLADALGFLSKEARNRDEERRLLAVYALLAFEDDGVGPLRDVVEKSRDPLCRAWALQGILDELVAEAQPDALETIVENAILGKTAYRPRLREVVDAFDGPELVAVMHRAIQDRKLDAFVKTVLVDSLASRDDPEVDAALRQALRVPAPCVQFAATVALRQRDPAPHLGEFVRLSHADDPTVQRVALLALGDIEAGADGWQDKVVGQSKRGDPIHRQVAAHFLAEIGSDEAAAALLELLEDPDRRVRAEAIGPILRLRRPESVPLLVERMKVESGRLRREVGRALRLLTGQSLRDAADPWVRWWEQSGAAFEVPALEEALAAEARREASRERSQTMFYGVPVDSDLVCFVIDASGSMRYRASDDEDDERSRLDVAKSEILGVLERLPEGAMVNLVFFDSEVDPWQRRPVPLDEDSRESLRAFVTEARPGGQTAMHAALRQAFTYDEIDTIYFLTDGHPEGGLDDPTQIRLEVERWNSTQHVQIHGVSIGQDNELVRAVAEVTGGRYVRSD